MLVKAQESSKHKDTLESEIWNPVPLWRPIILGGINAIQSFWLR